MPSVVFAEARAIRKLPCAIMNAGVLGETMIIKYRHPELGEDVQGRAGYYTAMEECIMSYGGREVLYVKGTARLERPCCGGACCWGYIQVPGYLMRNADPGRTAGSGAVSEVEIIEDEEDRVRIRQGLMRLHPGAQVEIWGALYAQDSASEPAARPAG